MALLMAMSWWIKFKLNSIVVLGLILANLNAEL
jgi:hypothetical protein